MPMPSYHTRCSHITHVLSSYHTLDALVSHTCCAVLISHTRAVPHITHMMLSSYHTPPAVLIPHTCCPHITHVLSSYHTRAVLISHTFCPHITHVRFSYTHVLSSCHNVLSSYHTRDDFLSYIFLNPQNTYVGTLPKDHSDTFSVWCVIILIKRVKMALNLAEPTFLACIRKIMTYQTRVLTIAFINMSALSLH